MSTGNLEINDFKKRYEDKVKPAMREVFGYKNDLAIPRLEKIVINVGVGRFHKEKNKLESIFKDVTSLCGQKPVYVKTGKTIAGFSIREDAIVGIQVILRGENMGQFFNKLAMIVLPRVRDFQGIRESSFDEKGNLSIGIKEHIVFPEIKPEESVVSFGLQITLKTTAKTKKEAIELLKLMGLPIVEK